MSRNGIARLCLLSAVLLVANGAPAQDRLVERGRQVYDDWCAICHAPGEAAARVLEERYQGSVPAEIKQRTNLTAEFITLRVRTWEAPRMPPFRPTEVSDEDLAAVIAYLRRND